MTLLGRYSISTKLPLRYRAGTTTAGSSFGYTYGNSAPGWSHMIWTDGANESLPHIEYPSGYRGTGWKMPLGLNTSLSVKYGLLSGQTAVITVTTSATGSTARPGTGSATITITADGTAGLVTMGEGAATITLSALGEIVAQLAAEGAATITITAEGDALTALGWPEGTSTITITAEGVPMAYGFMEGTTDWPSGTLTADEVANAVWEELAVDHDGAGTMGELLNGAGSAGDPWLTTLPGGYTGDQAGAIIGNDVYQAKIWMTHGSVRDYYLMAWFHDGEPIITGITSPKIEVIKAEDGTDLVPEDNMTQVGSLGLYKYESAYMVTAGQIYMAKVSATIDGATQTWYQPVGINA